jgi:hypothetical protein
MSARFTGGKQKQKAREHIAPGLGFVVAVVGV